MLLFQSGVGGLAGGERGSEGGRGSFGLGERGNFGGKFGLDSGIAGFEGLLGAFSRIQCGLERG